MTPHTMRHAQRLPNGDTEMECFCGAKVSGPEAEAVELYRTHMAEPALPSEEER